MDDSSKLPPAFRAYVKRALATARTPKDRRCLRSSFLRILTKAQEDGTLWETDWDTETLPSVPSAVFGLSNADRAEMATHTPTGPYRVPSPPPPTGLLRDQDRSSSSSSRIPRRRHRRLGSGAVISAAVAPVAVAVPGPPLLPPPPHPGMLPRTQAQAQPQQQQQQQQQLAGYSHQQQQHHQQPYNPYAGAPVPQQQQQQQQPQQQLRPQQSVLRPPPPNPYGAGPTAVTSGPPHSTTPNPYTLHLQHQQQQPQQRGGRKRTYDEMVREDAMMHSGSAAAEEYVSLSVPPSSSKRRKIGFGGGAAAGDGRRRSAGGGGGQRPPPPPPPFSSSASGARRPRLPLGAGLGVPKQSRSRRERRLDRKKRRVLKKKAARLKARQVQMMGQPSPSSSTDPLLSSSSSSLLVADAASAVEGTLTEIESDYFRDKESPSQIRPYPILKKALQNIKAKWLGNEVDYSWICNQFKSLRQDLRIQNIQDEFTVRVYESHARIALQNHDLAEFNQCLAVLFGGLYDKTRYDKNLLEFVGYRVLYLSFTNNDKELQMFLSKLVAGGERGLRAIQSVFFKHAITVHAALTENNYHKVFNYLWENAPKMSAFIIMVFRDRVLLRALMVLLKSHLYTFLPVEFVMRTMGFREEGKLVAYLEEHQVEIVEGKGINCRTAYQSLMQHLEDE